MSVEALERRALLAAVASGAAAFLPPVANPDSYVTLAGTALVVPAPGVLANDSDPNGLAITVDNAFPTQYGSLDLAPDGSFRYTPRDGFRGTDLFQYRVGDGHGVSPFVNVTIDVADRPPVANPDAYGTHAGATIIFGARSVGVLANDSDPDGDPIYAELVTPPANGTLNDFLADGTFSYTPRAGFAGIDSFTYRAVDLLGVATTALVSITVAPNRAPIANPDTYSTPVNTALSVPRPGVFANDTDPDRDAIMGGAYSPPAHGTLDSFVTDGSFRYTPPPGFTGTDTFTYSAYDGTDFSSPTTVTINVGASPAPTAVTQVFVNGPGLTGGTSAGAVAFRARAGIDDVYGYRVPAGTNQLKTFPWTGGVDSIAVRFSTDAQGTVDLGDLLVHASNDSLFGPVGFRFDAATRTAVWTFESAFTNQKLLVVLDDAGILNLDGEWANASAAQAYPSGNGTPGADFQFRVNVLAGDANQDGQVNALDLAAIKQRLNRTASNPGTGAAAYSAFADVNGDGATNALDLGAVKQRLNHRLPTDDPVPAAQAATSLLFD